MAEQISTAGTAGIERLVAPETISAGEANFTVPDKKHLHSTLVRNTWMVPPLKDRIMTNRFMTGIMRRHYFCIKQDEVRHIRQCADKPPRDELAKIVADVMANYPADFGEPVNSGIQRTAMEIRRTAPNVDWQLLMLAQFAPNHELFHRQYTHVKKAKDKPVMKDMRVANIENFFNDLPLAKVTGKRSRRGINFFDPQDKKRAKLDYMEQQLKIQQKRIDKERVKLNEQGIPTQAASRARHENVPSSGEQAARGNENENENANANQNANQSVAGNGNAAQEHADVNSEPPNSESGNPPQLRITSLGSVQSQASPNTAQNSAATGSSAQISLQTSASSGSMQMHPPVEVNVFVADPHAQPVIGQGMQNTANNQAPGHLMQQLALNPTGGANVIRNEASADFESQEDESNRPPQNNGNARLNNLQAKYPLANKAGSHMRTRTHYKPQGGNQANNFFAKQGAKLCPANDNAGGMTNENMEGE